MLGVAGFCKILIRIKGLHLDLPSKQQTFCQHKSATICAVMKYGEMVEAGNSWAGREGWRLFAARRSTPIQDHLERGRGVGDLGVDQEALAVSRWCIAKGVDLRNSGNGLELKQRRGHTHGARWRADGDC